MNIAKFKNMFTATGDEGEVITFEQLIQLKEMAVCITMSLMS